MNLPPTTTPEAAQAPSAQAQAQRMRELLRSMCTHLGASADETDHILDSGCLQLEGIDFALRLDAVTQHLEFYADCGVPRPADEHDLYRHLLEQGLSNEIPALSFALHPVSGHVVVKGSLFLPAIDEEAWLCTALVLTAVDRIREVHEKFTLLPQRDK